MTGKEWAAARAAMFAPGAVLECVENTYRPELNGTTRTVDKAGPTMALGTFEGAAFRMEMPKRVSEVEALEGGAIRYPIGRESHTVTLRHVS